MPDNAQKTPLGTYLDQKVVQRVSAALQNRSGRLPATLYQATDGTNTVWMVNFETDGTYTLPMVKLPVHTNEYARPPYKQGDKGFVSTADVDTTSMSNLNDQAGAATYARPANLAALVWHPLGNTQFKPVIDPKAHETYGGPSGTITHDGTQKSVVRTHPTDGTVISSGASGNAQGASNADGPHKFTAHPTDGTKIETPAAHTLTANNATLDAQGNETNQGSSTTRQNITSTTGNITAPAGAMSAPTGNFASGAIGGLPFSGGGSGVAGLVSALATALNGGAGGAGGAFLGATALAAGAASGNVGALGGDTTGMLPNIAVHSLLNVTRANELPMYNSNAAALSGGLTRGQLYLYNVSGGTYLMGVVV